jgi:hypothetical protein
MTTRAIALSADGRMPVPVVKGYQKQSVTKNDNKGARGKTSKYEKGGKEHREGIDISFRIEEEHGPVSTQREYVDKASHMRRPRRPFVPPEPTSRLCGCEDLAGTDGLRSDSYTADIESHHLLYRFAVSDNLKIKIADISNAYFQGKQLDRLLLTRPPKGVTPEPAYGNIENQIAAAVYMTKFDGNIEKGGFGSSDTEIKQSPVFPIEVTCENPTETIEYDVTEAAIGQMRSDVGSTGWVARQCRPGLGSMISSLQGVDSEDKENCHSREWRISTGNQVCRTTVQAEAQGIILDLKGWKRISQESEIHLWMPDYESLAHRFKNPKNKSLENARLSIDVRGLKQTLWKKGDGTDLEEFLPATLEENAVRWIGTSCMIVDSLTKKVKPDVTHRPQGDGNLLLKATAESDTEEACGRKSGTAETAMIMTHDISIGAIQSRSESTLTPELRV